MNQPNDMFGCIFVLNWDKDAPNYFIGLLESPNYVQEKIDVVGRPFMILVMMAMILKMILMVVVMMMMVNMTLVSCKFPKIIGLVVPLKGMRGILPGFPRRQVARLHQLIHRVEEEDSHGEE